MQLKPRPNIGLLCLIRLRAIELHELGSGVVVMIVEAMHEVSGSSSTKATFCYTLFPTLAGWGWSHTPVGGPACRAWVPLVIGRGTKGRVPRVRRGQGGSHVGRGSRVGPT